MVPIILLVGGLVLGLVLGVIAARSREAGRTTAARERARETLRQADIQKAAVIEAAREEAAESLAHAESELEDRREVLAEIEERIPEKTREHDRRSSAAANLQRQLGAREAELQVIRDEMAEIDKTMLERLSQIGGVSVEDASAEVLTRVEQTIREDTQAGIREIEADIKDRAEEISRNLLIETAQRLTIALVPSASGSSVPLTERQAERVTSSPVLLEQISALTNVTLTVNEEGTSVGLSAPDAVRRELARASLTEILKSGRVSANDIERLVRKQEQKLERVIRDEGIAAVKRAGCPRLPDQIIETLGRLKFRHSYGQNQLAHAVETAHLAAMLAWEIGADIQIARTGGLLHDLGKAIDREVEGTHAELGGQLAADSGLDPRIVHCIAAHHEEIEPETTEALITIVADATSGARPGARRESLEGYLARLEAIEAVANNFPGVEKCYAIQAGRELRVIVNPDSVDDLGAARIAHAVSERIQEELDYPGQIKVMVIRETKAVEHTH